MVEKQPKIIFFNSQSKETKRDKFNDSYEFCNLFSGESIVQLESRMGDNWKFIGLEIDGKDYVVIEDPFFYEVTNHGPAYEYQLWELGYRWDETEKRYYSTTTIPATKYPDNDNENQPYYEY